MYTIEEVRKIAADYAGVVNGVFPIVKGNLYMKSPLKGIYR
jgi:hypothetical protein